MFIVIFFIWGLFHLFFFVTLLFLYCCVVVFFFVAFDLNGVYIPAAMFVLGSMPFVSKVTDLFVDTSDRFWLFCVLLFSPSIFQLVCLCYEFFYLRSEVYTVIFVGSKSVYGQGLLSVVFLSAVLFLTALLFSVNVFRMKQEG